MKHGKLFLTVVLFAVMAFPLYGQQEYDSENDFQIRIFNDIRNEVFLGDGRYIRIINYIGNKQEVNIPPTIRGIPVTQIGARAFAFRGLTGVTIPDSVTFIGRFAFEVNQLTGIIIPPNLTSIEEGAFSRNQIAEVIIPQGVTFIGKDAFKHNQLTSIFIPGRVNLIEDGAFDENPLTSVSLPDNVELGFMAFSYAFTSYYLLHGRVRGEFVFGRDGYWSTVSEYY